MVGMTDSDDRLDAGEANWLHRSPKEVGELMKLLRERGGLDVACPICGRDEWAIGLDSVIVDNPEPRGLEVVPITCTNCAFTRFHSTIHLFD